MERAEDEDTNERGEGEEPGRDRPRSSGAPSHPTTGLADEVHVESYQFSTAEGKPADEVVENGSGGGDCCSTATRTLLAGGWVHLSFLKIVKVAIIEQPEVPGLQPGDILHMSEGGSG
ncbi:unnamed protein product [Pleuronectes platessa]|uniref:Uncharacterized protein n=1 Tax=Pleuronectes platessa TaxID=8262 RepID=A0A9N7TSU0_PLEPL|nr:unnamed protein product [Pleuronectes platessa]